MNINKHDDKCEFDSTNQAISNEKCIVIINCNDGYKLDLDKCSIYCLGAQLKLCIDYIFEIVYSNVIRGDLTINLYSIKEGYKVEFIGLEVVVI